MSELALRTGQLINYSELARAIHVSVPTVTRWVDALTHLHYCFVLQPWSKHIKRSLLKQPKVYLWDWSLQADTAIRAENMLAVSLMKATHVWTESGMGQFGLHFLRDKEKHEVDFLVTKNQKPWFIADVTRSPLPTRQEDLQLFQAQLHAAHALQVAWEMPFVAEDCFTYNHRQLFHFIRCFHS